MGVTHPRRGEVVLVSLDPGRGREIRETRPYLIVSPDELNEQLSTVIVAPMTTGGHAYAFRIPCRFKKRHGFVVLDQLLTVDHRRIARRVGKLHPTSMARALRVLREMFAD